MVGSQGKGVGWLAGAALVIGASVVRVGESMSPAGSRERRASISRSCSVVTSGMRSFWMATGVLSFWGMS